MGSSRHIKDLAGFGEIVRQVRHFAMALVRHVSESETRKLKNDAQRLVNDEQSIKNQDRRLQYVKNLLRLAEKYGCQPEELQAFTNSSMGNERTRFNLSSTLDRCLKESSQGNRPAPVLQLLLMQSSKKSAAFGANDKILSKIAPDDPDFSEKC